MNPNTVQQVANPLPFLLNEEAHGDHQATEAVFLTFNADPGFFEARILGACLSAGARVCLIGDGSVWNPDPYATKHAGRDYHIGLVTRPGAFHPKLMLLVGPKRALVAVGSGNVTMGGWQHNAETWTILYGDLVEAPAAMAQIADVVDDITGEGVDLLAAESLTRASRQLKALLAGCANVLDSGHQIVSSTRGPIIEQLPTTKAEELRLYAPFHDDASRGVAAVIQRLRPSHVTVMVQPGWTVLNPTALEQVLRASHVDWEIVEDAELSGTRLRYRHGKLIEWTTPDGQVFALTGSPNLSYAALCATSGSGNTEIAILARVQESLFPPCAPLSIAQVPRVSISGPEEQRAGAPAAHPLLLSAVMTGSDLSLTLNRPLASPGALELSLRSEAPGIWSALGQVPAGTSTPIVRVADPVPANSRLRLLSYDAEGAEHAGRLVFVTDKVSVSRRQVVTIKSRTTTIKPSDLFGSDLTVIAALASDLADLASDLSASKAPRVTPGSDALPGQPEPARDTDSSDWLWCQEQAAAHHGRSLAAFGLGMPAPPSTPNGEHLAWEDTLVEDAEAGLSDDTAETVDADPDVVDETPLDPPDHTGDHDDIRIARRRRIAKWADVINTVPVASSLIVLRLSMIWWSAGDWDAEDPEPQRVIATMLKAISRRDTRNMKEVDERVASLGLVALTLMRDRVDLTIRDEKALRFLRLRDELAYWVLDARRDLVEEYCKLLRRPSGMPVDPEQVMENVAEWSQEDPYADVVADLESAGYSVTRPGKRLLCVSGDFRDPDRVARLAAGHVPESSLPIGVWAVSQVGKGWALVIWDRPNLVKAVNSGTAPTRWRHQQLGPLLGPITSMEDGSHLGLVRHGRLVDAPLIAHELMGELGVASPHPPAEGLLGVAGADHVLS